MALATDMAAPRYLGSEPVRVRDLIKRLGLAKRTCRPLMIWGSAGVGKSAIVAQWAVDVGLGYAFLTLASAAPEDVQGIPVFTGGIDGTIQRKLIAAFRMASERACVLHIDEVTCASPAMLGAILSAIQDRRVGDTMLHAGTVIVLSANPPGTVSGGTPPSLALINRASHVYLVPDVIDFGAYLRARADRDPTFARWGRLAADLIELAPDKLIEFDAPETDERTWASPRALEAMIEEIAVCESEGMDPFSDPYVHGVIRSRIGRKAGQAWVGTMIAASKLPNPRQIAANPDAAPTPSPVQDIDCALACVAMIPSVIALDPAAAYVWAARFTAPEMITLLGRALSNGGAFPVGGFKGPLAVRATAAMATLAGGFNRAAAGK